MSTIMTLEGPSARLLGPGDLSDDLLKTPQLLGFGATADTTDTLKRIGYGALGAVIAMAALSYMKKNKIAPGITGMLSGTRYSGGPRRKKHWSMIAGLGRSRRR